MIYAVGGQWKKRTSRDVDTRGGWPVLPGTVGQGLENRRGQSSHWIQSGHEHFYRECQKKTFHLFLYFHKCSVPVDLNVVVAGILEDKFNLQCWTITPNVIIAVRWQSTWDQIVMIADLTSKVCSQPSSLVSSNSPRTTFQSCQIQRFNIALLPLKKKSLTFGSGSVFAPSYTQCAAVWIHRSL